MDDRKSRQYFKSVSVECIDVGPDTEVRIVTPQAIEILKKIFAGKSSYENVSFFYARVLSKDTGGLTIHLALTLVQRFHIVSEYLSFKDIVSFKIGTDAETYIVIKKGKYDSLWKKHSVSFAFIDLIGIKEIFKRSSKELMIFFKKVQQLIDTFANNHQNIAILSFADSLIVKSTWCYHKKVKYSPESFLKTILELRTMLAREIKIDSYIILTQGQNFIESEKIVHISEKGNHLGMLSVGPPFASLFRIESIVKELNKSDKKSLYIEKMFYDSLVDKSFFDMTTLKSHPFQCPFLKTINEFIAVNVARPGHAENRHGTVLS